MSVNNSDMMVINYIYREGDELLTESFRHYIVLKDEQKVLNASSIVNDVAGFPDKVYISSDSKGMISHEAWHEDYLIDVVSPYTELEEGDTVLIDGIGPIAMSDNPIILMMKLK